MSDNLNYCLCIGLYFFLIKANKMNLSVRTSGTIGLRTDGQC